MLYKFKESLILLESNNDFSPDLLLFVWDSTFPFWFSITPAKHSPIFPIAPCTAPTTAASATLTADSIASFAFLASAAPFCGSSSKAPLLALSLPFSITIPALL